jgi:hypothetical protein
MTSGQCDGQGDMPYPGMGANQHCAFNDVRWLWQDGSFPNGTFPSYGWVISGGDTVIIRGSIADGVTWRIGWNNSSGALDPNGLYYGLPGDPFDSNIPLPPSGTASQHTRILGGNYASCTSQSARTQLHGGWSVFSVLDLGLASYVDVGCVDITDFANCGRDGGDTVSCTNGVNDFASLGIYFTNSANHVTLTDVRVHGLAGAGIYGPTGDGFVGTDLAIVGNADSGWNADQGNGLTGFGSFLMQNFEISWNGCLEEYPIVDPVPYFSCVDGGSGGYGDGFGTATVPSPSPGWQVRFDQGIVSYNTQDGLDTLHINGPGSTLTETRILAFGNQGQQIKAGGSSATIQNSVIVGNCEAMTTQAIPGTPSGFGSHLAEPCRANNVAATVDVSPGNPITFQGNTIYSAGTIGLEVDYSTPDTGSGNIMSFNDNVFLGFFNQQNGENPTPIFGTAGLQMLQNPGSSWTNNATFGQRGNWTCPAPGETNAICGDPALADETYHPFGYGNMSPAANSSPVIGAGVAVAGLAIDFTGQNRSNLPTIGAYDSPGTGSTGTTGTSPANTGSSPGNTGSSTGNSGTSPANTGSSTGNSGTSTGTPQWTKIANENDVVTVPAGTTVRFGFEPNWDPPVTFAVATTFTATNSFFGGDPYPYQVKEVDVLGTGSGSTTTGSTGTSTGDTGTSTGTTGTSTGNTGTSPGNTGTSTGTPQWTKIANENDVVTVPAGTTVRFGFEPNWDPPVTFAVATTFTASNSFFGGDPYPYQVKEVDVLGTGSGSTTGSSTGTTGTSTGDTGTSSGTPQWTKVANENDVVNVPAGTTVRFGFDPNWDPPVTFAVATTFTASNSFFGGDPYPYQVKEVDVLGSTAGVTTGTQ